MTLPEVLLWQALRRNGTVFKWRRQPPAGPYNLDFYCNAAKLCVEVDGEGHDRGERPARDEGRDRWLADRGVETLRVPAADVLRDLDAVVRGVVARALERAPLHHRPSAGGPPPQAELGEE